MLVLDALLSCVSYVQQPQGVSEEVGLHFFVNVCVVVEAGSMVHLEEPRFELLVYQDIEAIATWVCNRYPRSSKQARLPAWLGVQAL